MNEEELKIRQEEAATAESLQALRTHRGWKFILDQVLDMRASAIEECAAASRDDNNNLIAERLVMRAAMRIDAVDTLLAIFESNVELDITEDEKQVMGMK